MRAKFKGNFCVFLNVVTFSENLGRLTSGVYILGGPVFQTVFQTLAPNILIKYLGYITNIPEVTMGFEHV